MSTFIFSILYFSALVVAGNSTFFNLNSAFALLGTDLPAETLDLPVGTCNADTPKGNSVEARSIGYYESWANTRPCSKVSPEDLNLDGLTHINFAFVFFDPNTFQIVPMDKNAGSLLSRFTKLKEKKPGLEAWVSVGGWSFNDPGPYQKAFSDMASTPENRKIFIDGLLAFMDEYGFDGMDMDWEYPTADDRGGRAEDRANLVLLCQDIYDAFSGSYGFSITLPASYWYLQHFDIEGIQPYVDWFNLMSYDLHGVWDKASKEIGPYIAPHTNLTEIDMALDLLWRGGLKPENLVLGQGFYGRSFTLEDPDCNKPNGVCKFSDGAKEGPCSRASGILTLQEIMDIIKDKSLTPVHDKKAGVKWIHWDKDQWVSYDDGETLQQKVDFANSRCLGGVMVWALDQVDQNANSLLNPDGLTEEEVLEAEIIYQDEAARGLCYTTKCGDKCRDGDHLAAQANGQPGQYSTEVRCPKDQVRSICCNKGVTMGTCRWRGYRGLGLSCFGGCADDEVDITQNTNHKTDKEDQSCSGGTQSFCCKGFKGPVSKQQVQEKLEDSAADLAREAAEALAIEVAAKAFCRIAIAAATAPLRFIPIVGIFISIALQAAMPALVQVCAKGIAKAGKTAFKFNGKNYDVKLDKPLETKVDRPKRNEPTQVPKKPNNCKKKKFQRAPAGGDKKTITKDGKLDTETVTRTCDGSLYTQACYHYSSVLRYNPALKQIPCVSKKNYDSNGKSIKNKEAPRPLVRSYNNQHHTSWSSGWMQEFDLQCQRDEYPPADIWQARDSRTWIRLIRNTENGGAGQIWKGVCPPDMVKKEHGARSISEEVIGCRTTTVYEVTADATQTVFEMDFTNMGGMPGDYGVTENPCWPKTLVNDPGFALLTDDPWYDRVTGRDTNGALRKAYAKAPEPNVIAGKVSQASWGYTSRKRKRVRKRNSETGDLNFVIDENALARGNEPGPDDLRVDEGNSTRRPTEEELLEHFGYLACKDKSCSHEMEELGYASLPYAQVTARAAEQVEAAATATADDDAESPRQTAFGSGDPRETEWVADALATATEVAAEAAALITPAPGPAVVDKLM
ncbi:Chitotriosidase-1 [Colletotrichum aenigma]|uniref:Chitotriosidase-1 n=1 Tax=Colletotrichum aenigma TaxID=1215731 RepID=UPI0018729975|nr:Chitotriosidase-1 [Colletotrichum aenigma]KAF5502647.1 Chitotriosidase-1 [Colletotrichum aenigma]